MSAFFAGAFATLLFVSRALLTLALLRQGNPASWCLGLLSAIALGTTVSAWLRGSADLTWGGAFVGVGHLVTVALDPSEVPVLGWQLAFWSCVCLQTIVKIYLGGRCTVTGPVFVSVEARGPYAWLRHPMTVTEWGLCCCLAMENPTFWNLGVLLGISLVKVASVQVEERFLSQFRAYRDYCLRVQWRLVPGVW